jgi:hypothetical protein
VRHAVLADNSVEDAPAALHRRAGEIDADGPDAAVAAPVRGSTTARRGTSSRRRQWNTMRRIIAADDDASTRAGHCSVNGRSIDSDATRRSRSRTRRSGSGSG